MTIRLFAGLRTAVLAVVLVLGTVALFWPFIVPAFAQAVTTAPAPVVVAPDTAVVVPVGSVGTDVLTIAQAIADALWAAVAGVLLLKLPTGIQAILRPLLTAQVEQLIQRSIDWGFNSAKNAIKGQTLSVNAGSEVLAHALNYAFANGWGWLLKWAGGIEGITAKILARIPLEAQATTGDVVANLPLTPTEIVAAGAGYVKGKADAIAAQQEIADAFAAQKAAIDSGSRTVDDAASRLRNQ